MPYILLYQNNDEDFISLTDIARHKDALHTDSIIQNWMRNRNTIELLGRQFGLHSFPFPVAGYPEKYTLAYEPD